MAHRSIMVQGVGLAVVKQEPYVPEVPPRPPWGKLLAVVVAALRRWFKRRR